MRFRSGDYIHRKWTRSWFLSPPFVVLSVAKGGYRVEQGQDLGNFFLSHSKARQFKLVLAKESLV